MFWARGHVRTGKKQRSKVLHRGRNSLLKVPCFLSPKTECSLNSYCNYRVNIISLDIGELTWGSWRVAQGPFCSPKCWAGRKRRPGTQLPLGSSAVYHMHWFLGMCRAGGLGVWRRWGEASTGVVPAPVATASPESPLARRKQDFSEGCGRGASGLFLLGKDWAKKKKKANHLWVS